MSIHLERDLESLKHDILEQSALVEEMIRIACRGMVERRFGVYDELLSREPTINEREVEIEEECLKILALHQPVAVDLRRVATVMKVNTDLERIGDLAVNISERTESLSAAPSLELPDCVEAMSESAIEMVRDALDAFVELDPNAARQVCLRDDEVDAYNRTVIEAVYSVIQDEPELAQPVLHLFSASRNIERIADHATNIAEDVIYLVDGEITRHQRRGQEHHG
ncbi:hypothetical protein Mal64_02690 [Pseudobythopirellula maris]|uniref:Phosphate-specific transport system accessory protein PhoU n=1 Tax=Pseudobythopirellula maris TaxID=2527991 RepID=A0A5C5ZSD3_9BACT|nr:phosphate signaling complex protein PhoU [Pseudobythopirellula maris]TWT89887.1 hypothetical protein Mal64_02690 [Pseudobythopirellula maris]